MFYQLKFFDPSISDSLLSTQAGIIVGAKTAAQVCTGMLWGHLADSEWGGRKTVLMIGLLSSGMFSVAGWRIFLTMLGLASVGYGFSKTFVSAVAWQVFGGAMSSNVGITRCVVAELNPEKR
jgi:MFS family permease